LTAGQIVITKGGTYTFATGNNNPSIPAVSVRTRASDLSSVYNLQPGHRDWDGGGRNQCLHGSHNDLNPGAVGRRREGNRKRHWGSITCWINGALQAIYVVGHPDNPTETKAQITINFNRLTNNWNQIQLNGLHLDPRIAIGWNEVISRPGSTDAINIYRSSGIPGAPILIHDNYVQGVAPATPDTENFSGSGIVTDGDTADPLLATSSVEIANNQVVGCVATGIALDFGTDQIAHDNVVVSSGLNAQGQAYKGAWLGICIEGDLRYQPAA
jgi:hypothetical protein